MYINEQPFLVCPENLSMLNIDWFNPYDDTEYSVGAIYLVVQTYRDLNVSKLKILFLLA